MSSTFGPDLNCEKSLSEHQARWNQLLRKIGAASLSDEQLWANPEIQGYTQWPTMDADLLHRWNSLSEVMQEDLQLNLSNTNMVRLMRSLGYANPDGTQVTEPNGRDSIADLRVRIQVALYHEMDPYLIGRLVDLRHLLDRTEVRGFTHLSWA